MSFTILPTPHSSYPIINTILNKLNHVALVSFDDATFQLSDTCSYKGSFVHYSPRLSEQDLSKFLVKNLSVYFSYIEKLGSYGQIPSFEEFWNES